MKISAGLLVYRQKNESLEVLLVHNGGPFFARKDNGVWSLPKGEVKIDEDPLAAAKREFKEELGVDPPSGEFLGLGETLYPNKQKKILAWAVKGDIDTQTIDFSKVAQVNMQWPPKSGKQITFPEVDRAEWYGLHEAAIKIFPPNLPFLQRLAGITGAEFSSPAGPAQTSLL